MLLEIIQLLGILLISVAIHEAGHMFAAILCGVGVKEFCIGFWKPKVSKVIKGIRFSITPILLGGYTALKGEFEKGKDCFLSKRYSKKAFILLSGAFLNLIVAFICYLINYGSITIGLYVDWQFLISLFTRNYGTIYNLIFIYQPNQFLLFLSTFNLTCVIFNLIPFPALDGSLLWLVWLEKPLGKRFGSIIQKICWIGFVILLIGQLLLIYWWWFL